MNIIDKYKDYIRTTDQMRSHLKNEVIIGKKIIKKNFLIRNNCPICNSTKSTLKYKSKIYYFYLCKKCKLEYVEKIISNDELDLFYKDNPHYQKIWKKTYNYLINKKHNEKFIISQENKIILNLVLKNSKNRSKCLEIGCAFGELSYFLKPYFKSVEGVELNNFTSKKGEEIFNIKIYNDYLENLNLNKNSYDVIILNQVIEHLPNFDMFKLINKLLKPGGILYLGCPYSQSMSMNLFKGENNHVSGLVHLNMFSFTSFKFFAKKYNFKIKLIQTDNKVDIQLNDVLMFFFNNKKFIHRYNNIPFFNMINIVIHKFFLLFFSKFKLISKYKKGSYLEFY